MTIPEDANKFLRDIANIILDTPEFMIKGQQLDAPRKTGPYGDIVLISNEVIGWENFLYQDIPDDTKIQIESSLFLRLGFSIGFYRDNAETNAAKVRQGLNRQSLKYLYNDYNLGLETRGVVRNISESFANSWENRAQFDVFLYTVDIDAEDIVESIGTIEIGGKIQETQGFHNFDINIGVDNGNS